MQPWMAVYHNIHYTSYMTVYWSTMNNLNEKIDVIHEQWTVFSIFIRTSILAIYVDQWI